MEVRRSVKLLISQKIAECGGQCEYVLLSSNSLLCLLFELSEDEESQLFFHSVGLRTGESEVAWGRTGNLTSS